MATITVNAQLILDESAGQQDDDTLAYSALHADFRAYLAANYAAAVAIESAIQLGMVTVTPAANETISALIFSKPDGTTFNGEQAKEADGTAIQVWDSNGVLQNVFLYSAPTDPDIVVAKTSGGDLVAAFYLNDAANNLSASIEMAAYMPLYHEDPTKADQDYLDWGGLLSVTAQGSLSFNFDTLESGKFLWCAVGDDDKGLLVTGRNLAVNQQTGDPLNGKDAGDMVNTSQGGAGATIGIDNQMMTPGDVATLTLVTGYTALGDGPDATGQNINEIQYSGYINTNEAGMFVSQKQGSGLLTFSMSILEAGGTDGTNPEQQGGYDDGLASDGEIPIAKVTIGSFVWTASGTGSDFAFGEAVSPGGLKVELTDSNTIRVVNADVGMTIMIAATAGQTYNRIELAPEVGKFDIGRIDVSQGNNTTKLVGDQIMTDDDGLNVSGTVQIMVDEDDMDEADADGDLSTGIPDIDSDEDEASFTDAALAALVTGRDQPAVFGLNLSSDLDGDPVLGTDGLAVYSQGDAVSYNINGSVIEGVASDGRVVFTLSRNTADDGWEFDLRDQIDHADASGDGGYRDIDLSPAFTVKDFDLDPGSLAGRISARVENDVPAPVPEATATAQVMEDALTGGNPDGTADDPEVDTVSATYTAASLAALATSGADEELDFSLDSDVIGDAVLDTDGNAIESKGVALLWAAGSIAGTLDAKAGTRVVFTLTDNGDGSFGVTLKDQLDHSGANDDEEDLDVDLTPAFSALDFDKDPVTLNAESIILKVENDLPLISAQIASSNVDFVKAATTGAVSLNGAVGADDDPSYVFTSYTDLDGFEEVVSGNGTKIEYFSEADDKLYYDIVLGQTGAGSYTFTVHEAAPARELTFNFDNLPSGQNLFGIIPNSDANGVEDLDGTGLLVIGNNVVLHADGTFTNASNTINTSQGGINATIGVNNQMFDPNDAAVFVYIRDPDDDAAATNDAGVPDSLDQNSADDADTIGYQATVPVETAKLFVSQTQGGGAKTMTLTCLDIPDGSVGDKSTQAEQNRDFDAQTLYDNLTGDPVPITAITVYNGSVKIAEATIGPNNSTLYADLDGDGNTNNDAGDRGGITVTFNSAGQATVAGFKAGYWVEFTSDGTHDAVRVTGVAGKWDIGSFSLKEGQDTPDQLLDFSVKITDHDEDYFGGMDEAVANFSVGIDGTGAFDQEPDSIVNPVTGTEVAWPATTLAAIADLSFLSLGMTERADVMNMDAYVL